MSSPRGVVDSPGPENPLFVDAEDEDGSMVIWDFGEINEDFCRSEVREK